MKKNMFLRVASVLLVLTLLSACAISGTFAKYTASSNGTDSARVAYWGFTSTDTNNTIVLDDLFKTSYTDDNGMTAAADAIAPGTTNSVTFKFNYATNTNGTAGTATDDIKAPEVAYKITVDTTGSECGTTIAKNPNILWKLDENEFGSYADMIADIKALSGNSTTVAEEKAASKEYAANTLPTELVNDDGTPKDHTITWKWIFDETAANANGASNNDAGDTAMGNAADLDNVTISIKITAEQIDTLSASSAP